MLDNVQPRDVAQLGSAPGWGSGGRRFKSCRPDMKSEIWTIPNALSVLRAFGIPLFLWAIVTAHKPLLAVIILIVSGATDYFDGKLARSLNQESKLGQLLDPAVDRLYIIAIVISLYYLAILPIWVVIAIFGRDIFLGVLLIALRRRGIEPFTVTYLGKAATFNLLYALPTLFLADISSRQVSTIAFIFGWAFTGWGVGLYLVTGVSYAWLGIRKLKKGHL